MKEGPGAEAAPEADEGQAERDEGRAGVLLISNTSDARG